ncbi:MAG: alanyl-tRNA editing protein [Lachnospiraceae bacterium]
MTEKIYDADTHALAFTATVLSCRKEETTGHYAVILDRTAFFPEEGGQGPDKGTLNDQPILHVSIDKENTITHILPCPFPEGSRVTGYVDWAQRFDYMQQHTGEHILSGLVHRHFGYNNVGFHLGTEATTLDFDGPLSLEDIRKMEELANQAVIADIPVNISFPSKEELANLHYRSKIELAGSVRIVEIPGIDVCACCAPHVEHTGQIGLIKVVDLMSHRGGVRVTILCGNRALSDYTKKQDTVSALSAQLSAKPELLTDAVIRLQEESAKRQERINELQAKLLDCRLAALPSPSEKVHALLFEEPMDTKAIRNAVNKLSTVYPGYSAIFTGNDTEGYQFILGSEKADCNQAAKLLRERLQAKCGGSALMIQGSVNSTKEQLTALFENIPAV